MSVRAFHISLAIPGKLGLSFTGRKGEYDGLFVHTLFPGSPCEGLVFPGDRILQINETHLISADISDDMALGIVRAVLSERPPAVALVVYRSSDWDVLEGALEDPALQLEYGTPTNTTTSMLDGGTDSVSPVSPLDHTSTDSSSDSSRGVAEGAAATIDPNSMALVEVPRLTDEELAMCVEEGRAYLQGLLEERVKQSLTCPDAPWWHRAENDRSTLELEDGDDDTAAEGGPEDSDSDAAGQHRRRGRNGRRQRQGVPSALSATSSGDHRTDASTAADSGCVSLPRTPPLPGSNLDRSPSSASSSFVHSGGSRGVGGSIGATPVFLPSSITTPSLFSSASAGPSHFTSFSTSSPARSTTEASSPTTARSPARKPAAPSLAAIRQQLQPFQVSGSGVQTYSPGHGSGTGNARLFSTPPSAPRPPPAFPTSFNGTTSAAASHKGIPNEPPVPMFFPRPATISPLNSSAASPLHSKQGSSISLAARLASPPAYPAHLDYTPERQGSFCNRVGMSAVAEGPASEHVGRQGSRLLLNDAVDAPVLAETLFDANETTAASRGLDFAFGSPRVTLEDSEEGEVGVMETRGSSHSLTNLNGVASGGGSKGARADAAHEAGSKTVNGDGGDINDLLRESAESDAVRAERLVRRQLFPGRRAPSRNPGGSSESLLSVASAENDGIVRSSSARRDPSGSTIVPGLTSATGNGSKASLLSTASSPAAGISGARVPAGNTTAGRRTSHEDFETDSLQLFEELAFFSAQRGKSAASLLRDDPTVLGRKAGTSAGGLNGSGSNISNTSNSQTSLAVGVSG